MFPVGTIVKFAIPNDQEGERDLRFVVVEADEVRPLVRLIDASLPIPPTYRHNAEVWVEA